jgi:hypothetical protein
LWRNLRLPDQNFHIKEMSQSYGIPLHAKRQVQFSTKAFGHIVSSPHTLSVVIRPMRWIFVIIFVKNTAKHTVLRLKARMI